MSDNLIPGTDLDQQVIKAVDELVSLGIRYGLDVLGAIVLLAIGWMVAGFVRKRLRKRLVKSERIDDTVGPFVANVARYLVLIVVLVAVLAQFGVQTASIVAALGAAGIAIGLALQGTLSNIAAGMMLLFLRPLRIGDHVEVQDHEGIVDEIGVFTTILHTFDGVYRSIPNSEIWDHTITNYTRRGKRRVDVDIGISYGDSIADAAKVLHDILGKDERVLQDPEPQVIVNSLADSAVVLSARGWVETENYWGTLFDMRHAMKDGLDEAGISIPFPQRDIHIVTNRPQEERNSMEKAQDQAA
ncbi:MAG: mechanosensitive ion channel family protein [Alphaproteobacteria bacterium]